MLGVIAPLSDKRTHCACGLGSSTEKLTEASLGKQINLNVVVIKLHSSSARFGGALPWLAGQIRWCSPHTRRAVTACDDQRLVVGENAKANEGQ